MAWNALKSRATALLWRTRPNSWRMRWRLLQRKPLSSKIGMLGFLRRLLSDQSAVPASFKPEPDASGGDVERSEGRILIEHDDWGFAEFVHQRHWAAVERELRSISAISENQDSVYGWNDIHLRNEIKEPLLPATITLKALHDLFPRRTEYAGIGYWGDYEEASNSFAFGTGGGLMLYGDYYPGIGAEYLRSICFKPCNLSDKHVLSAEMEALARFAARQQLYLICWNQEFCSQPDAGRYLKFFEQYK